MIVTVSVDAASEDRLRSQTGVRERFQEGVQTSRRYIKAMEEIFRREGLPVGADAIAAD